jgi:putative hydrolase of the HAD superfamily
VPSALLLEFGRVISVSVFERHRETELILGLEPGTLTWLGPLAPATDPLWQSMLRGEISERDYWHARARETGELVGEHGWDMPMLLTRVRQTDPNSVVRPEIDALVFGARAAGIHVGILSNELELFYGSRFLAGMHFLKDLDVIVDATHTGILKPDPRVPVRDRRAAPAAGADPVRRRPVPQHRRRRQRRPQTSTSICATCVATSRRWPRARRVAQGTGA